MNGKNNFLLSPEPGVHTHKISPRYCYLAELQLPPWSKNRYGVYPFKTYNVELIEFFN